MKDFAQMCHEIYFSDRELLKCHISFDSNSDHLNFRKKMRCMRRSQSPRKNRGNKITPQKHKNNATHKSVSSNKDSNQLKKTRNNKVKKQPAVKNIGKKILQKQFTPKQTKISKQNNKDNNFENDISKSEESETREILAQFEEKDKIILEQSPGPKERLNRSESYSGSSTSEEKSLQSINEEDDSRTETMSPKAHLTKRSSTHMRFQTKADICVEEATPVKKNNDDKDQYQTTKQMNVENKENLLNLNVPKVKKQKTMSTTRNDKQTNKKCSIKKSETKTSKWSTNVKNIKKEFKSTARSKTIERQFTISSSISSIR